MSEPGHGSCSCEARTTTIPLFLQAKEAQRSVLADYVNGPTFSNEGERVVNGQRLMQAASDIFLGWQQGTGATGSAGTSTSASSATARALRSSKR